MEKTTILRDTFTPILEKVNKLPMELARLKLNQGEINRNGYKEYIYENDEKIAAAFCALQIKLNRTSYYTKMTNRGGMSYNKKTKKLSVWGKESIRTRLDMFNMLIDYMNIDWFKLLGSYTKYSKLPIANMMTITLASHILSGKVKNPEGLIKDYLLISHKVKNIPWKLIRDYFNNFEGKNRFQYITLHNIFFYSTNPISALNKLAYSEYNDIYYRTLNDVLEQCFILNKKVNFSWSLKRLNEEHEKLTNILMEYELGEKDNTPIAYEGDVPLLKGMSILNTEYETYKEATYMHNCIFSNYWKRIKTKEYIAFKYIKDGVHYDIGIFLPTSQESSFRRWHMNPNNDFTQPMIDQIKGLRNSEPPKEIKEELTAWFNSPNVYDFFASQHAVEDVNALEESHSIAFPF